MPKGLKRKMDVILNMLANFRESAKQKLLLIDGLHDGNAVVHCARGLSQYICTVFHN